MITEIVADTSSPVTSVMNGKTASGRGYRPMLQSLSLKCSMPQ